MIDFDRILGWAIVGLIFVAVFGGIWQTVTGDHGHSHANGLIENGQAAPPFSAYRHGDHAKVTSDDWKGKVVVLDFWATWCGPCREEAPIIRQLTKDYLARDVVVLAADQDFQADDPTAEVSHFLEDHALEGYPVVYPPAGLERRYRVEYLPTIYVIGKDGRVRFSATGSASRRRLHAEIDAALAEPAAAAAPPT